MPDGIREVVSRAVERCALVGIVTGRGLERAQEMVPLRGAWFAALHGTHIVSPDGVEDRCHVTAGAREPIAVAAQLAQPVGWAYEDKGATVTVHFRQRGSLGQTVDPAHVKAQLQTVLNPLRTEIHDAKQVLEIKPKGARTKGDAVRVLTAAAAQASVVVYVGDDLTDLDAFDAIDELRAERPDLRLVKVAVGSLEAPPALVASADVLLEGEHVVEPLLTQLVGE